MNFTEIMNTCNKVKSISSTNEKKEFLASITDEDFKNFLKWEFDSSIISGLSEKKINKMLADDMFDDCGWTTCDVKTIFDVFRYLEFHKTGTDNDIRTIQWYRKQICKNDEEVEFFNNVVTKNVIIGCDVKLINSVWEGLIPTFSVGLCDKYYGNEKIIDGTVDYLIDTKTDGCRCVAIKENGSVRLTSRGGKPWLGMIEIEKAIKDLPQDNIVFDSEITVKNPQNYPSLEVYDRTIKIVTTKSEEKVGLQLNCFDYMTLEEWNNQESKLPCIERKAQLEKIIEGNEFLVYVENLYVGKDPNVIEELMNTIVEDNDMEGLVVKVASSPYQWKRTKNWLKVKKMQRSDSNGTEVDATIVGYYEGKNKNKGKLGGLICIMEHPTYGHIEFKCGGGFSDYMREYLFSLGDKLIGRTISIQYFESSKNSKTNVQSLRFPVFLELKEEGQEPNN
jgi:hypothetical protein